VQLIRDTYDGFSKGDMQAVGNALADDIVWRGPGWQPVGRRPPLERGGLRVPRPVGRADLGEVPPRRYGRVFGRDETVVGLATLEAERNGKTLSGDAVHVWRVENSKAVEVVMLYYGPYAAEEFYS
jgi:ketosteroid isomerase-like protein